ncbi:hypothetical protein [Terasakiella sp. A23]|uniref:hypothetical protein n=1 Tax=Terasakiella sp. FCG-A23 TaxID=3080561 RepID=UPI002954BA79|nr:hypothetical protein [Terasakiella sp. A23]
MIIQNENSPLFSVIQKFLVANELIGSWSELAAQVQRSRTYFSTLRRTNRNPSSEVWDAMKNFLSELVHECRSETLVRWLEHYIRQIEVEVQK